MGKGKKGKKGKRKKAQRKSRACSRRCPLLRRPQRSAPKESAKEAVALPRMDAQYCEVCRISTDTSARTFRPIYFISPDPLQLARDR